MTESANQSEQLDETQASPEAARTQLLALRGKAEMLVLQGARALELLCHGRYQNSLRFETPNAPKLIADNTARLTTLAGELENQAAVLSEAVSSYDGPIDELLKEEIEDHIARQVHFARIVGKWRGELER